MSNEDPPAEGVPCSCGAIVILNGAEQGAVRGRMHRTTAPCDN